MSTPPAIVQIHGGIGDFDAAQWDAMSQGHPFIRHAFLKALEDSGCISAQKGWLPRHLGLYQQLDGGGENQLLGAAPCYLKGHSYGEYVFDHAWADAYERAGGRYYPKLQIASPFTPVTGPRLLVSRHCDKDAAKQSLLKGLSSLCDQQGLSSAHLTFLEPDDARIAQDMGYLMRSDQQFHWHNDGYDHFDDFLAALSSRKRKQIKKERREAVAHGISIKWIAGPDIRESDWDAFYTFYRDTSSRKWGTPYLNRDFFSLIGASMADQILLFLCENNGRPIAGALNFCGPDTLYGRYWGCIEDHPCLHFETCYYQAIDYAIAHRLKKVEAGAQGPHKLARGYAPVKTWSAHHIADAGFREAVRRYLDVERQDVEATVDLLTTHLPFKHQSG
ncbi:MULTISPECIES: GNAT family N-acetyltransferase [unclassified Iodidimonas]|jgi:predicted N-acyltransferase|uniref:GNAT family N-acetyltransferase n=1 Tax=unclassified Iodidimonas TaxID=2626145 RepID=UPI002482491F|nr:MULTISPECIES: GNAT family N-acetyltransferase [unclassified Iodidimonas]